MTRGPVLAAAGARPETRPPRPHITVARPPRKARGAEIGAASAWAEAAPEIGAAVELGRVALFTWAEDRSRGLFRVVESREI